MTSVASDIRPGAVWIDAQLPPALATWLITRGSTAVHIADLGLLRATDREIFEAARAANAIVITKDEDFVHLLEVHGPPPRLIWVTVGNVRNAQLLAIFAQHWTAIDTQLAAGEPLIELARRV